MTETTGSLSKLPKAKVNPKGSSEAMMIAYQLQSIDPLVFPDVSSDVSVRQPRSDDTKRKQCFGNPEEGQHIRMRNILPPDNLTVEPLIGIRMSSARHNQNL